MRYIRNEKCGICGGTVIYDSKDQTVYCENPEEGKEACGKIRIKGITSKILHKLFKKEEIQKDVK